MQCSHIHGGSLLLDDEDDQQNHAVPIIAAAVQDRQTDGPWTYDGDNDDRHVVLYVVPGVSGGLQRVLLIYHTGVVMVVAICQIAHGPLKGSANVLKGSAKQSALTWYAPTADSKREREIERESESEREYKELSDFVRMDCFLT